MCGRVELRVSDLGFGILGFRAFRVWFQGLGFRFKDLGLGVYGLGFRV